MRVIRLGALPDSKQAAVDYQQELYRRRAKTGEEDPARGTVPVAEEKAPPAVVSAKEPTSADTVRAIAQSRPAARDSVALTTPTGVQSSMPWGLIGLGAIGLLILSR